MKLVRTDTKLTKEEVELMMRREMDCGTCTKRCANEIEEVPDGVRNKITVDETLYGSASAHAWHILLCSGVSNNKWANALEEVEDSYTQRMHKILKSNTANIVGGSRLSTITRASENGVDPEFECDVIIFPVSVKFLAVKRSQIESLIQHVICGVDPKTIDTANSSQFAKSWNEKYHTKAQPSSGDQHQQATSGESGAAEAKAHPLAKSLDHATWILICGHKLRDKRCGLIAPVLQTQFISELTARNLSDKVDIDIVSHVGGHKFAGNVIIQTGVQRLGSVWYGRVFPEHVAAIVEHTIVNHKLLKPLYRGSTNDW